MNPAKVNRKQLNALIDLPNIGPALAKDLSRLGYRTPQQIAGADPMEMYERLSTITATRQDPCVLDTFISVTRFLAGEAPKPWWHYTAGRKKMLQK